MLFSCTANLFCYKRVTNLHQYVFRGLAVALPLLLLLLLLQVASAMATRTTARASAKSYTTGLAKGNIPT